MAGIAGMSSPNDIKINTTAASPQGVSIPQSEVQAEPQVQDLDTLATQFVSQQPAQDLDSLAQSYVQDQAPVNKEDLSFYEKMTDAADMGWAEKAMVAPVYGAIKGLLTTPAAIAEAVAGGITNKDETKSQKLKREGTSIMNAFMPSGKTADLRNSYSTIFPAGETDVVVKLPKIKISMDEMDELGMPKKSWDGESVDVNVKPNDILTLATDIVAGEGAFKIASKAGKQIISKANLADEVINGWISSRQAAKAAEAVKSGDNIASTLTPKISVAKEQARDMAQLADEMTQAGLIKNVDGFDIPLAPSQIDLKSGKTMVDAEYLSDMPKMEEFIEKQAIGLDDSMQGIFETLAPGYARNVAPKSIPIPNLVKEALKKEAVEFTATRAKAYKIGKDYITDAAPLRKELDDLISEFGISSHVGAEVIPRAGGSLMGSPRSFPKLAELAVPNKREWLKMMTSRGYADQYSNLLFDDLKQLDTLLTKYNGRVPFGELQKSYSKLRGTVSSLYDTTQIPQGAGGYRNVLTKLKNTMQSVYDDGVGKILGGDEQVKYMESVAKYSDIKTIMSDFGKASETEMGASALSKWIFQNEGNANSISRVKGMKDLMEYTGNSEKWDNVVGNYLHRVIKQNTGTFGKTKKTNWNKVFSHINDLDPEVQGILFGQKMNLGLAYNKTGVDVIKDATALMDAVERGTPSLYKTGSMADKAVKYNGVKALTTIMAPKASAAKAVGSKIGDAFILADKEAKLAEFLSKEGIEDVLKFVPPAKRGFMQDMVDSYVLRSRKSQKIKAGKL